MTANNNHNPNKTINQHYVPRSYLKYFADNERIWVYDKKAKKSFSNSINTIASEKFFYDFPSDTEGVHKQWLEKHFANNIEGNFKNLLNHIRVTYLLRINPKEEIVLNDDIIYKLSKHIVIQYLRTKTARDNLLEFKRSSTQIIADQFIKQRYNNPA